MVITMAKKELKIGFVVNPIAGMGGRVGLKGTDGVYEKALELGAEPVAPKRAKEFLSRLYDVKDNVELIFLTAPREMGEEELKEFSLSFNVLPLQIGERTTAEDTKRAVNGFLSNKVDLIVFVGGDGTARDIMDVIGQDNDVPVLGVPSGVKMYSGVFAINPRVAADLIIEYVEGKAKVMPLEVMDIDEEAFRENRLSIKLYGYMNALYSPMVIQGSKHVSPDSVDEHLNQEAIARYIVDEIIKPGHTYILGPGTTVKAIADLLGVKKTLLGVDIYQDGKVINDVNEEQILKNIKDFSKTWIIVSPIGHQGMIFGRGNQQISPKIIKLVGKKKIIVIATQRKIRDLADGALKVDTGDPEVDEYLRGYFKVIIDYGMWRMVKVI